jgi:dipeptidyl aminopeptidase/acylaminoacyl peptidase
VLWLEGAEDKWFYYAPFQLAVADLATGAVTRPARIDRSFYFPKFAPDGSIISLIEQDRDTWLARIDPANGHIEYLNSGFRFGSDFTVASNGRVALLESDVSTPAEIFAVDGRRQLTHHNAWTADRAQGEVRDVSFASGDAEIHGYVTLPAGFDPAKRYPLLTSLHGGPVYQHSHEFDLEGRLFAAAGYAVLAINPRGSSGRGFDFSRAIYADWGNLDVKDISAGITHAINDGIADPKRIGVLGWSYGGILTDYMIASDPRIRAAVSGAGVANVLASFGVDMYAREYLFELGTPWENFDTWRKLAYPFLHPERITSPTLFQCAGADDNVPCVGAQQMYLALKTRDVPTRLIVYPGENHGLDVPSYLVHRMRSDIEWFDRWLKASAP